MAVSTVTKNFFIGDEKKSEPIAKQREGIEREEEGERELKRKRERRCMFLVTRRLETHSGCN